MTMQAAGAGLKKLPPGMSADDYYNDLIHSGALQERNDGKVLCPIPSFRQFLIEVSKPDQWCRFSGWMQDIHCAKHQQQLYYGFTWDATSAH